MCFLISITTTDLLLPFVLFVLFVNSEYFGKLTELHKPRVCASLSSSVQLSVAQLAMDLSSSGGFNEIILASWNSLRHQQHNMAGSEEQTLRTYSFISLAHFFVTFVHLRLSANDREHAEPAVISAVANVFDKHVFHWLRMTWDQFEQSKGVYGMVLVSGLVKEMLGFLETVVVKGSPADKFACEVRVKRSRPHSLTHFTHRIKHMFIRRVVKNQRDTYLHSSDARTM